jgi:hypothetical protein
MFTPALATRARNFAHRAGPILDLGDEHLAFLAHLDPGVLQSLAGCSGVLHEDVMTPFPRR